MTDIFISYAREDRPAAQRLAQVLTSRGWNVWWDRELIGGDDFEQAIEEQLRAAGAVVVLWSEHSVRSRWVRSEAALAADRGVMIPVLLRGMQAPMQFRTMHAIDLTGWTGSATGEEVDALASAVTARCGSPRAKVPLPPPPSPSEPKQTRRRGRAVAALAGLLAVVAMLVVVVAMVGRDDAPTGTPTTTAPPDSDGGATTSAMTPTTTPTITSPESTTTATTVPPPSPPRELHKGTYGEDVLALQVLLKRAGISPGDLDGQFGPDTESALAQFEDAHNGKPGIAPDRKILVGGAEWQLLENLPPAPSTTVAEKCTKHYVQVGAVPEDQPNELQQVKNQVADLGYPAIDLGGDLCAGFKTKTYRYVLLGPFDDARSAQQACDAFSEVLLDAHARDPATYSWITQKRLPYTRSPEGLGARCGSANDPRLTATTASTG